MQVAMTSQCFVRSIGHRRPYSEVVFVAIAARVKHLPHIGDPPRSSSEHMG